jgi:NAD(P)-dependent dehydrogenase (short-subunit alcohol dehydrogenase family)
VSNCRSWFRRWRSCRLGQSYDPAMDKKRVVITGSSRGIGKGLALEFLRRGHQVVVNGRSEASVSRALAALRTEVDAGDRLIGVAAEVDDYAQVQHLWDQAAATFGGVDIWINNAGISNSRNMIGDLDPQEIINVNRSNLLGTMFAAKIALIGMTAQGHGHIYNFEGLGSNGRVMPGLSLYGATKYAITYFTKCMIKETKGTGVKVGYLSPGIVLTHLSLEAIDKMPPDRIAETKRVFNILADRVETVTPWLVEKVLADRDHGSRIAWLTPPKAIWRFLRARFAKRDLFAGFELEQREV